jgi:hypothetical protein
MKFPFTLTIRNVVIAVFQDVLDAVHEMKALGLGAVVIREDGREIARTVSFTMPTKEPGVH